MPGQQSFKIGHTVMILITAELTGRLGTAVFINHFLQLFPRQSGHNIAKMFLGTITCKPYCLGIQEANGLFACNALDNLLGSQATFQ